LRERILFAEIGPSAVGFFFLIFAEPMLVSF
jgi:hypothetical protein